uniref:Protein FAR1-RELATED SEQUENCE n=1 Tax=Arundo donax TaxID=35708 RepID=A0A0A9CF86_ARUDO
MEGMWRIKENFVPVYFKQDFCPFVNSTARSEGTNALFKMDVGPTYIFIWFMHKYKRITADKKKNQRTQDYKTKRT